MGVAIEVGRECVMKSQTSQHVGIRRVLPVLGIFVGGAVYSSLPRGAFGAYDTLARVLITAVVAGSTAVVLGLVFRPPPPT